VELQLNKAALAVVSFVAGAAAAHALAPAWKAAVMLVAGARYQELTYKCDRVMRNHMIEKQRLVRNPGAAGELGRLQQAEIGLIDCQDYDLYRKSLVRWGLSENDLSTLALETIEGRDTDLQKVIATHEIRY
jgi:hypothetical protein